MRDCLYIYFDPRISISLNGTMILYVYEVDMMTNFEKSLVRYFVDIWRTNRAIQHFLK
jgi:hypothetical protein